MQHLALHEKDVINLMILEMWSKHEGSELQELLTLRAWHCRYMNLWQEMAQTFPSLFVCSYISCQAMILAVFNQSWILLQIITSSILHTSLSVLVFLISTVYLLPWPSLQQSAKINASSHIQTSSRTCWLSTLTLPLENTYILENDYILETTYMLHFTMFLKAHSLCMNAEKCSNSASWNVLYLFTSLHLLAV